MTKYDLSAVHEAVGNAYTQAQNLQDDELREGMIDGVINVARQSRAAEEMDNQGLFEAADALEYGAEGMADVFLKEQAKNLHAHQYREAAMEVLGNEQVMEVLGNEQSSPTDMARDMETLQQLGDMETLLQHLEDAADAQRDAVGAEKIAEETATAYGASLGLLLSEYEPLQKRFDSDIREGDEDRRMAVTALQEIDPGEGEVDLGIEYNPSV
jgi:hypothetical protein|nr:MAG: hypothetical protein J07AB56_09050 [Candidatus Nanosalinarum sp. J07AB56]